MKRRSAIAVVLLGALAIAGAWALLRDPGAGGPPADADPAVRDAESERPDPAGRAHPESAGAPGLHVGAQEDPRTGAVALRLVSGDTKLSIEGARVTLEGESEAGKRVRREAATDERGAARVDPVPAGEAYVVRVTPPEGRVLERRDVAVREAATTDLGTLYTGAHGTIEGVVVDEGGNPVPGAAVAVAVDPATLAADDGDAFPTRPLTTPVAQAECGKDGAFVLADLPVGLVALHVSKVGYRSAFERVLLESGVKTASVRILLTRGIALRGRVEERDGTPVAHATVEAGPAAWKEFEPREETETDEQGRFEIAGFGHRSARLSVRVTPRDGPSTVFQQVPSIERFLRLVLPGGAVLAITVFDEVEEVPLAEARVRVSVREEGYGGDGSGPRVVVATTNGAGVVQLPAQAGDFPSLAVSAKGHLVGTLTWERGALSWKYLRTTGDLRPLEKGETRPIRAAIRRGPLVVGTVRTEEGAAVPRARVWLDYGSRRGRTVETDGSGEYRMGDAELGLTPTVVARSPDGRSGGAQDLGKFFPDALSARVDVTLVPDSAKAGGRGGGKSPPDPAASVRGRVVDEARRPLPDVRVRGGTQETWTDGAGTYFVPSVRISLARPGVPPQVCLFFTADGYLAGGWCHDARDGDVLEAPDLVLGFGATIRGTVLGPKGLSPAGGSVFIDAYEQGPARSTIVTPDGTFVFRALAPRTHSVRARGPGWIAGPVVAKAAGGSADVELTVQAVYECEGRVTDETGAAVEGAVVELVFEAGKRPRDSDDESQRTRAQADASGAFRVSTASGTPTGLRIAGRDVVSETFALPKSGSHPTIVVATSRVPKTR